MANTYGFLFHPYLTIKRISSDRSQISIFTTLWLVSWLMFLAFGIGYLFINDWSPFGGRLFWWGVVVLVVVAIVLLVLTGYLAYWIIFWWRRKLHNYRQRR